MSNCIFAVVHGWISIWLLFSPDPVFFPQHALVFLNRFLSFCFNLSPSLHPFVEEEVGSNCDDGNIFKNHNAMEERERENDRLRKWNGYKRARFHDRLQGCLDLEILDDVKRPPSPNGSWYWALLHGAPLSLEFGFGEVVHSAGDFGEPIVDSFLIQHMLVHVAGFCKRRSSTTPSFTASSNL